MLIVTRACFISRRERISITGSPLCFASPRGSELGPEDRRSELEGTSDFALLLRVALLLRFALPRLSLLRLDLLRVRVVDFFREVPFREVPFRVLAPVDSTDFFGGIVIIRR